MKVLAKTDNSFILEASIDETASITGHYLSSNAIFDINSLSIGEEKSIHATYQEVQSILNLSDKVASEKAKLQKIVDDLAKVQNIT